MTTTTSIEEYKVGNKKVFVKRDDTYGKYPLPSLGKLRGLSVILENLYKQGFSTIGCWDTRVSRLGQGVAVMCNEYGMKSIISYPVKRGEPIPEAIQIAEKYNAEILPLRGNHISICYAQAATYVKKKGGFMLPFGMECLESVTEVAREAEGVPAEYINKGTLVLSCGSGVTLAGILTGLKSNPSKIIGISSGRSIQKIERCLCRYVDKLPSGLEIREAEMPYYEKPDFDCPFNTHPNYDLKAWKFLVNNIHRLKSPVLFWNIGA